MIWTHMWLQLEDAEFELQVAYITDTSQADWGGNAMSDGYDVPVNPDDRPVGFSSPADPLRTHRRPSDSPVMGVDTNGSSPDLQDQLLDAALAEMAEADAAALMLMRLQLEDAELELQMAYHTEDARSDRSVDATFDEYADPVTPPGSPPGIPIPRQSPYTPSESESIRYSPVMGVDANGSSPDLQDQQLDAALAEMAEADAAALMLMRLQLEDAELELQMAYHTEDARIDRSVDATFDEYADPVTPPGSPPGIPSPRQSHNIPRDCRHNSLVIGVDANGSNPDLQN